MNAIFLHDYPLAVELGSTPRPLEQNKTCRASLPIDMLLSAVSVLAVAQSSSEIPEGLMNNPVLLQCILFYSQHFKYVLRYLEIDNNIASCIYHLLK